MKDFDKFCEKHNIQPDELGVAFAAWMSQATGWDGNYKKILNTTEYPPEGQNEECDTAAQTDTQEHPGISASATSDTLPEYECAHQWVHIDGDDGYGATPVAICVKCYAEKTYCPKCGEKLEENE